MPTSEHSSPPDLRISLLRAAAPWKRAASATTVLPEMEASVTGWAPDRARLAQYRAVVGSIAELPIAYPQVPVMAMHMDLLSRWSFPVRAMGLVHLGSAVSVLDELSTEAPWDLRAWGSAGRHVRAGLEFDLWGEVSVGGRVCWRSRAVYLSRSPKASGAEPSTVPDLVVEGPWQSETVMPVEEGTGRAFGRVTGDINPIHLHAAAARPFGFSSAIAHGWWTTGRAGAMLEVDQAQPGRTLEMVFRRPVRLPSRPVLCARREPERVEFALVAPPGADPGHADPDPAQRKVLHAGRVTG